MAMIVGKLSKLIDSGFGGLIELPDLLELEKLDLLVFEAVYLMVLVGLGALIILV